MSSFNPENPEPFLRSLFNAAVAAADPALVVPRAAGARPSGPVTVVGAGKAAAAMAVAIEAAWGGPLTGLVITRYGGSNQAGQVHVAEASHPVPDDRGVQATQALMAHVRDAPADGTVVGLWSGGASALLVQPVPELSLEGKQQITQALLASGAPIQHINTVRKHLSLVKGGRLAALAQSRPMLNLMISDVVGDDLSVIGSGPTVADPTTCTDALVILKRYQVDVPKVVVDALQNGGFETPKSVPKSVTNRLVASPRDSLTAATQLAEANRLKVINLGDAIEGEARDVAVEMAGQVRQIADQVTDPTVVLSGGEVTVTLPSQAQDGAGGPNLEFSLALALALDSHPRIWAIAGDTDGFDGSSMSAGAVVSPTTLSLAEKRGLDPRSHLNLHNTDVFFGQLGTLVTPGDTATNVNDFRAVLIIPRC